MEFITNSPHIVTEKGDKIVYPFGPPIFQTHVDSNFTKELIEEGRKLNIQEDDWNPRLAGNLKYGRSFHYKNDYLLKAEPYLLSKVEDFFNAMIVRFGEKLVSSLMKKQINRQKQIDGKLTLDTLWINFSKKHDYNPIHTHTGVLSFVIYCKVPTEIFKVQADSNAKKALSLADFAHSKWLQFEGKAKASRPGAKSSFDNKQIAQGLSRLLKETGFDGMASDVLSGSSDSETLRKYVRVLKGKMSPLSGDAKSAELLSKLEKMLSSRPGAKATMTREQTEEQKAGLKIMSAADPAVGAKIATLIKEGKPQDQAVAIALDMKRRGEL